MSADFLLELRSEEIPARMQAGARADLERLFRKELVAAGITPGAITVWSTPRRLALIARAMPLATQAVHEEVKGPRTSAPAQALEGFLRKTGLSAEQLTERDGVWFAVLEKPGRATAEVLAAAIPAIIRAFPWPKTQRWGAQSLSSESLRWVRPLSGIVALLGGEVVPFDVGGIVSGRETLGHRFMHRSAITIDGADDYADKLRAAHVIVDHVTREAIVRDGAQRAAADAGLVLVEDEGLVIENAGLTEWPVPLLGRFDPEFLAVPPEVIQLTARVNQKYFICRDQAGALANAFICTANIVASDGGAAIIAGNRKVLAARLSDARFFWDQDQKTPLAEQAKKLARITFHEKLGSLADKVARVADLAEALCAVIPGADPVQARLAADLCKADLVTEMVGEFPELQGLMGGYYARAEGLPDAVADAIRDHYKPVGQGDDVPTAPVSVAVALADKLDTLRGFFAIDEKPTGSKDPFALRRAALGIIRLILENDVRLPLRDALIFGHGLYAALPTNATTVADELSLFFADRLKNHLRDKGVGHDRIAAAFRGGDDDLFRVEARAKALDAFLASDDGRNLVVAYRRAANIARIEGQKDGTDHIRSDAGFTGGLDEENALNTALDQADRACRAAGEDFAKAMGALAGLRAPLDAFFDKVTVNSAVPEERLRRLGLLGRICVLMNDVADFSAIEG